MIKRALIYILAFAIFISSASPVIAESISRGTTSISAPAAASTSTLTNPATDPTTKHPDIDQPSAIEQSITSTPVQPNPSSDTTRNDFPPADNSDNKQTTTPDTTIDTATQQNTLENTTPELTPTPSPDPLVSGILKPKEELKPIGNTFKLEADTTTGALIMEYPIEVPPGRNGLQPDLALIYNSQNTDNDNIFGYGWSINIPYIERINKKGTDKLYSENFFNSSISGELATISPPDSTYGKYGTYGTKIENGDFLQYEYKNDDSWEASDKNGLIYKFGLSQGARQYNPNDFPKIYKWMLEEIRDTNDNFIKYEYFKEEEQIYPSKIKYTGNGIVDGILSVEFNKVERNDKSVSYKTGFKINTKYLISSIIKKGGNDTTSQQYDFEYQSGNNGKRSVLSKITEQGNDPFSQTIILPPDKFDYQKNTGTWAKNTNYTVPVDLWNDNSEVSGARIFDVNGDALPDIVFAKQGQPTAIYINKGDDTGWQQDLSYSMPIYFVDSNGNDLGVRIGDVNGDHLEDLLYASPNTINSSGTVKGQVYLNKGNNKKWSWDSTYAFPDYITFIDEYETDTGVRVADINGDGLADIVGLNSSSNQNSKGIYLNKGDGTGWVVANYGIYTNPPEGSTLADVNGDGLVDSIKSQEGYGKQVFINTGKDWQEDSNYSIPVYFTTKFGGDNGVRMDDANSDGLPDIFYANSTDNYKVYINKGNGTGWEEDSQYIIPEAFIYKYGEDRGVRLADVNGDGLTDFIRRHDNVNDKGSIYTHPGKISDLLKYFYNKKGSYTQVDYLTSPRYKNALGKLLNPKLPFLLPLVQKIYNFSETTVSFSYEYEAGEFYYKNPLERKFAGFKIISEKNAAGQITKNYYHQGNSAELVLGEWDSNDNQFGDGIPKIGKLFRIDQYDENNNLYKKTFQRWQSTALGNNRDFVRLAQEVEIIHDGNNTKRARAEKYSYDTNNGNLIQKTSMGEVQVSDDVLKQGSITSDLGTDKFTIDISYTKDATKKISLPASEIIKDQNLNKISETQIFYDNLALLSATKGNVTKQSSWINGDKYTSNTVAYNSYGLPTSKTDTLGNTTTYQYDLYNLFPAKITNAINNSESYTYDYSSGNIKQYTDPNGLKFENIYDALDRIKEEKQPDQTNPTTLVTKTVYTYYDNVFPSYITKWDKVNSQVGPTGYIYFDGLGRIMQTRQEVEDPSIFSIKDYKYDNKGLLQKESLPYIGNGGSKTSATANDNLYIKYTYDALDRPKTIQNTLGATIYTYNDWETIINDAENNYKNYVYNAYGNLTKVIENNNNQANFYETNYQYNGLNNLTKITDALGNVQNFSYDGLGRRLSSEDLHATNDTTFGTHTYSYDDASNLISETDQNGQIINYSYDKLNRPTLENYTGQNGDEATYTYDNCTYGIGQLCKVANLTNGTDTVITQYEYIPAGFTSSEKRTIDGKDYLTQFSYDYLGNPLSITYPDNSVTTYTNNSEGKIKSVKHQNNEIIKNITYAATGAPEEIKNANGTTEKNTFDQAKLYRLTNKSTTATQSIQNISYTYDKVGNVKQIVDSSNPTLSKTANYQYDNLYRLKSATITNAGNGQNYTHTFQYNALGNLTSKTGQGNYSYAGNLGTSYATPHAVTAVGTTNFSYDKNGNLLSDGKQTYKWDYKNRLIEGSATGLATKYLYDHSGERVKKSDGKNWTIYVNNFYEIRNDKIVKHIYADDDEVAAIEIPPGGETQPPPPTPATAPKEVIYEDAEDGDTLGWKAYGTGSKVTNSYEDAIQSQVIVLSGPTTSGGFGLKNEDGTLWNNSTEKVFSWDMKYKNNVHMQLYLDTNKGKKYLAYTTKTYNNKPDSSYIYIGLDPALKDDKWHTITRDLQADITLVQPETTLAQVKSLSAWEAGKLDNIKLSSPSPSPPPEAPAAFTEVVYEDAEDGDTLGWEKISQNATIANVYENEKQGKIIALSGPPPYGNFPQGSSGFKLKNEDGTLWNNSTEKILSWDMNYKNDIYLTLQLDTNKGEKDLIYSTTAFYNTLNSPGSTKIFIILDPAVKDEKWHTITRNLQADVSSVQSDTIINTVKYLKVWHIGTGKFDNIKLTASDSQNPPATPATVPSPPASTTQTIYHHTDHLSGTSIETDANGKVIEMTDYYPFGEIRIDQSLDPSGTATGYKNPYKFTGKELDTDIGLYYYGARYYNPAIGRFVSMDPWEGDITNPQSLNKYSYVMNNPFRYVDKNGEFAVLAIPWVISGAEILVGALTVAVGTYIVSNDHEIPAILDNSPPDIKSEPYVTPIDMVQGGLITSIPVGGIKEQNVTTIPGTSTSSRIENIPAQGVKKGMNVMMQKEIKSLKDSIKSWKKQTTEHKQKIRDLQSGKYQIDPSKVKGDTEKYKKGLSEKWKNEVKNYKNLIKNAKDKIKKLKQK